MKKNHTILIVSIVILMIIALILLISQPKTSSQGSLEKITYDEVKEKINNNEDFVLIVSQSTCSHCATYKPKVKIIAENYGLTIYYLDYDLEKKSEEFLNEFNLTGASPITLFFNNGKEKSILNRLEGDLSSETVIEKLKKLGFIEK